MDFLNPLFWIATVVIAGPILLHLVEKEKRNRIPFASLMMVPRVPIKQMQKRRIENLLLLLLRCLGIVLIVGAFARPVATGAWFDRLNPLGARSVVVLLDDSHSMSRDGVWTAALDAARARLRSLSDGDEVKLVIFSESTEAISQWESNRSVLEGILGTLEPSFQGTSYLEGLRFAAEQFDDDRNQQREIYLITDLQRNGMSASQGWKIPEGIEVEVEDVGRPGKNLYADEVRVVRNAFGKTYPSPILMRIVNSPAAAADGTATLFLGETQADRKPFAIDESGVGQLTFEPFDLDEGISRAKIVLDFPDDLAADNSFHFVVDRREPRELLLWTAPDVRSSFYLRSALETGDNLPFVVHETNRLRTLDPAQTPLLVINEPRTAPPSSEIKPYLEAGGGVIIVLGAGNRAQTFDSGWRELLPTQVGDRNFVRSRSRPFTSITDVSWDHPIFQIFQDIHKAAVAGAQFYSYWILDADPLSTVVARFDEGDPFLLERTVGVGKVLMLAAGTDPVWTDFGLRPSYLPFWARLVDYAANWQASPAALRINQVLPIKEVAGAGTSRSWEVLDPLGERILSLEGDQAGSLLLKRPGYYEIRDNKSTDWVAVNVSPLESDLERIPVEDLQAVFVPTQSRIDESVADEVVAKTREKEQSLWWLLLALAAAVFVAEAIVANRSRPVAVGMTSQ